MSAWHPARGAGCRAPVRPRRRRAARRCRTLGLAVAALWLLLPRGADALDIKKSLSPRNHERPKRASTLYIILHTTEGPEKASLNKVRENGECHFFVTAAGQCYRIMDVSRVAYHAGRSMWNGRKDIDTCSIGIECSGYYTRGLTSAQYRTLAALIAELQRVYGVTDDRVMPHSMVAYGAPNLWHRRSHRGRKRCGAFFADAGVRAKLGLTSKPAYDPDVKAGRLVAADPWLSKRLFAGASAPPQQPPPRPAAAATPIGAPSSPKGIATSASGLRTIDRDGVAAAQAAGSRAGAATTFYLWPDGQLRTGTQLNAAESASLPRGTRVLIGYTAGGAITAKRSAFDACGSRWNAPSTVYWMPDGSTLTGAQVREGSIPAGARIFFQN